jgi:hypothetical protein
MKRRTNQALSQRWLAEFERLVVNARPEQAGKIDWVTAAYFNNSGLEPLQAASKYLASLNETQVDAHNNATAFANDPRQ